jgi:hypothetical protein
MLKPPVCCSQPSNKGLRKGSGLFDEYANYVLLFLVIRTHYDFIQRCFRLQTSLVRLINIFHFKVLYVCMSNHTFISLSCQHCNSHFPSVPYAQHYLLPVLTTCSQQISAQLSCGPYKGGSGVTDSVANFVKTRHVK